MKITTEYRGGFSLTELMISVAILAVISLIAAPALKNYLTRSKVTETIGSVAELQSTINNQIDEAESITGSGTGITVPSAANLSRYITSISVSANGTISITTSSDAGSVPYTLTPTYNSSSQQTLWSCAVTNSSYNDLVPDQCKI